MGWVKVDDQFADHPKFEDLSNDAVALWIRALAYCNRHMTDGAIKAGAAFRMAKTKRAEEVANELVAARLWIRVDGGFQVHDFMTWSTPRDERQRKAEEAKARKNAWRERQRNAFQNASGTQTERVPTASPERTCDAQSEDRVRSQKDPPVVPQGGPPTVPPVLTLAPTEASQPKPKRAPAAKTRCPARGCPDAELATWLVLWDIPPLTDANFGADVARFVNNHRARSSRMADWHSAWVNWRDGRFLSGGSSGPVQRDLNTDPDETERQRLGKAPRRAEAPRDDAKPWDDLEGPARRLWGSREAYEAACLPRAAS